MQVVGFLSHNIKDVHNVVLALLNEFRHRNISCGVLRENGNAGHGRGEGSELRLAQVETELSSDKLTVSLHGKYSLEDALAFFTTDVVLAVGFEGNKTFPRILTGYAEKITPGVLRDGLVICAYGKGKYWGIKNSKNIQQVADIILKQAFKLPNLDCARCGCPTCYDFARTILAGDAAPADCASFNSMVRIQFDSGELPITPFVSAIVEKTIRGMLSSLKGYHIGPVEIAIPGFSHARQ
jgi:molybdopterin-guanine dinucleotide biosynthesis protein B